MTISRQPFFTTPRWLQAVVIFCAAGLLPLGVAYAQEPDFGAVGKRLIEAVKAGELSESQAEAMIGELARVRFAEELAAARREGRRRFTREDYARTERRLKEAVDQGKVSGEDARTRLGRMRFRMVGQGESGERRTTREDFSRAARELKKAVGAGEVSKEDARARLGAMRRMIAGPGVEENGRRAIRRRRGAAVESGKMTREEATGMLESLHARVEAAEKEQSRELDQDAFVARIKEAVRAGELTREEAGAKLRDFKRRHGEDDHRSREEKTFTIEEYRDAEVKMRKGIKEGRFTKEDVERRLIEMRKRIVETREAPDSRRSRR
jgi:hypothetical protein